MCYTDLGLYISITAQKIEEPFGFLKEKTIVLLIFFWMYFYVIFILLPWGAAALFEKYVRIIGVL